MGEQAVMTAIATVLAALISGIAVIATQRSAAAAAVRNQSISSRTDIEKEAFERAKGYYTDAMDRQAAEIGGLETDVATLRGRVSALEEELAKTKSELDIARRALQLKYPDE
jgi:hypothetical protein